MKKERLFSLDVLRGLDMFYLAVASGVLSQVFRATGAPEGFAKFFCSHPWGGFTLYDLIMPLFIFMCGAAVPLALKSRTTEDGAPTAAFHRHVWFRFAMLWALGLLAQGNLQQWRWDMILPYSNTLQTIAVGYVVTAYVLLVKNWAFRIAVPAVLALIYGLVVHFGGDYTPYGNVTMPFERWVLSFVFPPEHHAITILNEGGWYWYTWFLPSLMFSVISLCGAFSTLIITGDALRFGANRPTERAIALAIFGAGMLGAGWFAELVLGVDCVKQIFTVSFTFQAIGWSILALALLYVLCDVLKIRRGWWLFTLFGQSALFVYVMKSIFAGSLYRFTERFFDQNAMDAWVAKSWQGCVRELLVGTLLIVMVVLWQQRKGGKVTRPA